MNNICNKPEKIIYDVESKKRKIQIVKNIQIYGKLQILEQHAALVRGRSLVRDLLYGGFASFGNF